MKPLFICLGNVARSQMAEAFYNYFTKTSDARSAGATDRFLHYVHPLNLAIEVMNEEGIDISGKLAKQVTKEMLDNADKVFVLCNREACPAFLTSSNKVQYWAIPDPYRSDIETYRSIRDLIKEKVKCMLEFN